MSRDVDNVPGRAILVAVKGAGTVELTVLGLNVRNETVLGRFEYRAVAGRYELQFDAQTYATVRVLTDGKLLLVHKVDRSTFTVPVSRTKAQLLSRTRVTAEPRRLYRE